MIFLLLNCYCSCWKKFVVDFDVRPILMLIKLSNTEIGIYILNQQLSRFRIIVTPLSSTFINPGKPGL
jgi:hypothetical protein